MLTFAFLWFCVVVGLFTIWFSGLNAGLASLATIAIAIAFWVMVHDMAKEKAEQERNKS